MAFCSECGGEYTEGVKFCSGCGFKTDVAMPASVAVAQETAVQSPRQFGLIECPYCHSSGTVVVQQVKKKKSVSTGKATAALLTGGISLIGTGLAKKAMVSQLTCAACGMTWEA